MKTPSIDPDIESLDVESVQQLSRLDKHHINIRISALVVAIVVIFAIAALEIWILLRFESWQNLGDFVVFVAITPILSITVIVVFILIGSFKRSDDADIYPSSMMRQVLQHLTGGSD